jgi:hypothetical protein
VNNRNHRQHQQRCKEHLEATKHAYMFRPDSGLYEPKSAHPEDERQQISPGANPVTPLFVDTRTDWGPSIVAAFLSVLTLLVLGWYTYVTQGILETSQATAVGTIQAAWAAKGAADTASAALRENIKQFRQDERPYLVKEYIKIKKPQMGEKLFGEVLWRNTGKTPALTASLYIRIDVLSSEPYAPEEWEKLARTKTLSHMEMGSNLVRATDVNGDNFLSGEWFNRINAQTYKVYVFGAFVYQDIFKEWHATDFCAHYEPGTVQEEALWACKNGNDVK